MYVSHSDETDPERIKQIIERAISDTEWLLNKVRQVLYNKSTLPDSSPPPSRKILKS